MKRASYSNAVNWIAENDEPTWTDREDVGNMISVQLVADLWGVDSEDVARDVVRCRARNAAAKGEQ